MDFITSLPRVEGNDCIFVMVDRLTKFVHFFAITTRFIEVQVDELFFKEVFYLHGLPMNIINNRDSRFLCIFSEELFKLTGIELNHSISYHL